MYSIRRALLRNLLGVFGIAWLALAWSTWLVTRHEIEEVFDAELAQAAGVIALLALEQLELPARRGLVLERSVYGHAYERNIAFQVWEGERLVLRSQSAPDQRMCMHPGFADHVAEGRDWRVTQRASDDGRHVVCAGESHAVRREMVANITLSTVAPAVLLLPLVGLAVWIGVGRGLAPLARVTAAIERREAQDLGALALDDAPLEVRPLTQAIDDFLARLREAFAREARFTADAAHELRTPLASIRTQAQVAQRSGDDAERSRALAQLLRAVDNGVRLVEQMLTLARYENLALERQFECFDPLPLVAQTGEDLASLMQARGVRLRIEYPAGAGVTLHGLPAAFGILVRNLVENAVNHSPPDSEVGITLSPVDGSVELVVGDAGPGIAPEERQRVLERFYRGKAAVPGAGLGLAIVRRIAELHGAELALGEGAGGRGLEVRLRFPAGAIQA